MILLSGTRLVIGTSLLFVLVNCVALLLAEFLSVTIDNLLVFLCLTGLAGQKQVRDELLNA